MTSNTTALHVNLLPAEVAERLRVHKGTLLRWRKAGTGPPYIHLDSGAVLYPLDSVLTWEAAHLVAPGVAA